MDLLIFTTLPLVLTPRLAVIPIRKLLGTIRFRVRCNQEVRLPISS